MRLQYWKEEQNSLELVVFFLSPSLSFCLHRMEVLWFAACLLLDFSSEGLMSWIIMFWGSWCFLGCGRAGNEGKFVRMHNYQLSFRILIDLEAFGSCKHTRKPHCGTGLCIPRAPGRDRRCFNQSGVGIQRIILLISPLFPANYLLPTTSLHHWCSFLRPRGVLPHPSLLISW